MLPLYLVWLLVGPGTPSTWHLEGGLFGLLPYIRNKEMSRTQIFSCRMAGTLQCSVRREVGSRWTSGKK
jgi:hypothetical protein